MKKLFGILTVVALMTTAAFAQEEAEGISFSSSGRAVWIAVANSRSDSGDPIGVGGLQLPWGPPAAGPRTSLTVKGTSEHVGFWLDIFANGDGIVVGDNALIWVKPFSWARLVFAGNHDENVGRSGAEYKLFGWDRIGVYDGAKKGSSATTNGNDFIFPDLLDKTVSLEITPIEGLLIGGAIDLQLGKDGEDRHFDYSRWTAPNIFGRGGSLLISYTAAEIVTIKFGLSGYGYKDADVDGNNNYTTVKKVIIPSTIVVDDTRTGSMMHWVDDAGKDYADTSTPVIIDAAVEATPIEGLTLALGAHAPTVANNYVGGNFDPRITFKAAVGMVENLNIGLRFGLKFLAIDKNTDKWKMVNGGLDENGANSVGFTVGLGADYTFDGPGVNIFLDVGYADGMWMANNSAEGYDSFTIGAGVSKNFSNGSIGIAFAGTTNGDKWSRHAMNAKSFGWEIPVMVTYSF